MNAMKACQLLVQRLEELSTGADRARQRSILRDLDRVGGRDRKKLQQMLGTMASGMSEALGDIVERLARLDGILQTLEPVPAPSQTRLRRRTTTASHVSSSARVRSRKLRARHRRVNPRLRHGR